MLDKRILNILVQEHNRNCSLEFILSNRETINFDNLSRYHTLDLNFLAVFQDELNWNLISRRKELTEEIVLLYFDFINWYGIRHSDIYTTDFKRRFYVFTKYDLKN